MLFLENGLIVKINEIGGMYEGLVGRIERIIPKGDEDNCNDEDDVYVTLSKELSSEEAIENFVKRYIKSTLTFSIGLTNEEYEEKKNNAINSTFSGETIFSPEMLINNSPNNDKFEWIDINERKPEKPGYYLTVKSIDGIIYPCIIALRFFRGKTVWSDNPDVYPPKKISHWIDLKDIPFPKDLPINYKKL